MKEVNFLPKNGVVSLVAPSCGCSSDPYKTRLEEAIKNFKNLGYTLDEGENIFLNKGKIASNTPKKRADEFMKAYLSSSNVIISVGGGELMNEMLPFINFKKIKKANPKLFMGFSDNTNLTYLLTTICEIPTIYGSNFPAFGYFPFSLDTLDSYNLITGKTNKTVGYPKWQHHKIESDNPLEPINLDEEKIIKVYPKKDYFEFEGMLLGGNLDILSNLCGTKYDVTKEFIEKYKDNGFIWFLEACDLNVLSIRRALFTLKEAGWFKYCKGFLIGRPLCFKEKIGNINQYNAVKDMLKEFNVPLLMDVDLGHFAPTMPIFTGKVGKVIYQNNNIEIIYK